MITGASSGIGKATALLFQKQGWNVIASMRTPEKEEGLARLENVFLSRLDVLDVGSINDTINKGIERFGKIDVLLNNAGYGAYGPLEAFPREHVVRQFDTNVIGLLDVTKGVIPHFRAQKAGVIINVSSVGGKVTFPLGSLYHGSKFAVEGISEALSFEMKPLGVRVKLIEPGFIATDFGGRSFDFKNDEAIAEYQPLVAATFKAFADAGDSVLPASLVANVILKAARDESDQLRYRAGADAEQLLNLRKEMDEDAFVAMMHERYTN